MKLLLQHGRLLTDDGLQQADLLCENGRIAAIGRGLSGADQTVDLTGCIVLPGLVDMHVHFRDPGQTHKEDLFTGAAAAAAGGVTSVACMPNTTPTVDTIQTLQAVIDKAKQAKVRIYPISAVTQGMAGQELVDFAQMMQAGAIAFSDDGQPIRSTVLLQRAMAWVDRLGITLISHCEDREVVAGGLMNKGKISEHLGVPGIDRVSEDSVTAREIAVAAATGCAIHIAHVSTEGSVALIRDAKRRGVRVTAETCPHYFLQTDEELLARDANFRMNPPLREERDRQAIFDGVVDGTIDCIVTDHAPHAPAEKRDFLTAPNGAVGLETSLAATLTAFYHTRALSLEEIVARMAKNPARLLRIPAGNLALGEPADLCAVDLEREWTVDPERFYSKGRNTTFAGKTLRGQVQLTVCRGEIVYQR